jgi:hypothetical protein
MIFISSEVAFVDERTKQVQIRLTPDLHSRLKGTLALEGRKLVDFFSEAAIAYLLNPQEYYKTVKCIIGDKKNG